MLTCLQPSMIVPYCYTSSHKHTVKTNLPCPISESTAFQSQNQIHNRKIREKDIIGSASPPTTLCKNAKLLKEGTYTSPTLLKIGEMQSAGNIGMLDIKDADMEAQNLLKWLATSQTAEDINFDDELACETAWSPLLPATTVDKMLEKENIAFENESQQEYQDILDSIDETLELDKPKEKPSRSIDHTCPIETSSGIIILQVDGSNDDEFPSPCSSLAGISNAVETKGIENGDLCLFP